MAEARGDRTSVDAPTSTAGWCRALQQDRVRSASSPRCQRGQHHLRPDPLQRHARGQVCGRCSRRAAPWPGCRPSRGAPTRLRLRSPDRTSRAARRSLQARDPGRRCHRHRPHDRDRIVERGRQSLSLVRETCNVEVRPKAADTRRRDGLPAPGIGFQRWSARGSPRDHQCRTSRLGDSLDRARLAPGVQRADCLTTLRLRKLEFAVHFLEHRGSLGNLLRWFCRGAAAPHLRAGGRAATGSRGRSHRQSDRRWNDRSLRTSAGGARRAGRCHDPRHRDFLIEVRSLGERARVCEPCCLVESRTTSR